MEKFKTDVDGGEEARYVISGNWFNQWIKFISTNSINSEPTTIFNQPLYKSLVLEQNAKGLKEGEDFFLIT